MTIDERCQEFNQNFDRIMKVLIDSITLEINIVSVRIAETTSDISTFNSVHVRFPISHVCTVLQRI